MGFTAPDETLAEGLRAAAAAREALDKPAEPENKETPPATPPAADAGNPPAGGEEGKKPEAPAADDGSKKPDAQAPEGKTTPPDGQGKETISEEVVQVKTRVRGTDRVFDLRKEEDRTDLVRAAQLGMNYEHLRGELDQKIEEAKGSAIDEFGLATGIAVRAPNGVVVPTVEGAAHFLKTVAEKAYGDRAVDALRAVVEKLLPEDVKDDFTDLADSLDPDDPKDGAILKLLERQRASEAENRKLRADLEEKLAPVQTRFAEADQAAKLEQTRQAIEGAKTLHETEVKKYPILGTLTDSARAAHIALAKHILTVEKAAKTPQEALALAVKRTADEKLAERREWEKQHGKVASEARPTPGSSPPKATGTGAVPGTAAPGVKNNQTLHGKEKENAMLGFLRSRAAAG